MSNKRIEIYSDANSKMEVEYDLSIGLELNSVSLHRAYLVDMSLVGFRLYKSDLRNASFDYSDLSDANLSGSILVLASFKEVNFERASLINCKANSGDFINANFSNANCAGTVFDNSKLHGANFTGAKLEDAKFQGAKYDLNTIWPHDFNPKNFGAVFNDNENVYMYDKESDISEILDHIDMLQRQV
ncbi:pentapeptide repeat-containing protein [Erysipelothrix sp. HDW6C]|uniref:pentapeptide repeat-containing protein n=1 Tax=Erysipelothrix sp. HDW6C TaxID=2714930 RepID=UPI001409877A|nr:pentapeptide repeat-containing protein [Erysipelothrix sp. HDW6C]QIK70244.1 pentapeptide repeat-containing protein [Erysipelothrix sp. HDW6C]